jgi:predicted membrane protein
MREAAGDLGRRALAILVLIIAAWILLKIVIGIVAGLATIIVAVLAIVAIVWAIRSL